MAAKKKAKKRGRNTGSRAGVVSGGMVSFRLIPEVAKMASEMATQDERSVSGLVRWLIRAEHARRNSE